MTSPHDPHEPVLTDAEEQEVIALLAAEGSEPVTVPSHVVTRLDDVLASLVADRARPSVASSGDPAVVPLADRRRPRRWPQVLLAAAAVVVGGYAVGTAGDGALSGGSSDAGGASESSGSSGDDSASSADEGRLDSDTPQEDDGTAGGGAAMSLVPTVRRDHLAADVRRVVRLLDQRPVVDGSSPSDGPSDGQGGGTVEEGRTCPVPRLTEGQRFYEVRFRGAPAGLVVGAPAAGTVDVTVYACEDGGVRLSRSVPAP